MPRKPHIPHPEYPYHVTARSHGGTWFHGETEQVWSVMSDYLYFVSVAYGLKIHAFVLMSNHFHLLASTPNCNLSEAMNYFMRETSKELNRISGKTNQVFGNRFSRSLVNNPIYYQCAYKYIYRNPVTAGIADSCEEYKFSSLHGLLGLDKLCIPIAEDTLLFEEGQLMNVLKWLNTPPTPQNYEALRKALTKKILKFPKNRWTDLKDKHTLEMGAY